MNATHLIEEPYEPGKRASLVLAAGVHLVLLLFLFYGIRWQTRIAESVEVELVRAAPVSIPQPPVLQKLEPKASVEPEPPRRHTPPEIAIKEKPVKEKTVPKVVKEPPKPKDDSLMKKIKDEFDNLAKLTKLKNDDAAKAAQEQELANELAKVGALKASAARNKAVGDYRAKIRGKIKGNITVLPPNIVGNPEALFEVVQLPSGEIISVKLKKSSGHAGYDDAVERAILKSSPLPEADPKDIFERSLLLKFRPKED